MTCSSHPSFLLYFLPSPSSFLPFLLCLAFLLAFLPNLSFFHLLVYFVAHFVPLSCLKFYPLLPLIFLFSPSVCSVPFFLFLLHLSMCILSSTTFPLLFYFYFCRSPFRCPFLTLSFLFFSFRSFPSLSSPLFFLPEMA